jgi:hypothetical protein
MALSSLALAVLLISQLASGLSDLSCSQCLTVSRLLEARLANVDSVMVRVVAGTCARTPPQPPPPQLNTPTAAAVAHVG